jgi:dGTPase
LASVPSESRDEVSVFWKHRQPIIEAQIVNIADIIAYATHDLEDALEVGLLGWTEFGRLVKNYGISFVEEIIRNDLSNARERYRQANREAEEPIVTKVSNRTLSRLLINKLVLETVAHTRRNLDEFHGSGQEISAATRQSSNATVALQAPMEDQLRDLVQGILFNSVYREPRVMIMMQKAERILDTLFSSFMKAPEALPRRTQAKLASYYQLARDQRDSEAGKRLLARVVGDYISGMTDKYAMDTYQLLTQAYEKTL